MAARTEAGCYVQLSGNELGVLLGHHLLVAGGGDGLVLTTVVSSPQLGRMARSVRREHDTRPSVRYGALGKR